MNYLKTQWRLFKLRRKPVETRSALEIDIDQSLAHRKANREHFAALARSDASRKGWLTRRLDAKNILTAAL